MYLTQATGGQILVMTKLGDFGSPQVRAALAPQMEGDMYVAVARPSGVGCKEAVNLRTGLLITGPMADSSEFRAPLPFNVDLLPMMGSVAESTRDVVAVLTSIKSRQIRYEGGQTIAMLPISHNAVEFGGLEILD